MSLRKERKVVVKNASVIVPRIPGSIAFNDLLERITNHGMEVDGGSKLMAIDRRDKSHLLTQVKMLKSASETDGTAVRRRGAPLPRP